MGVLADHQIRALCEPSFQRPAITPFAEGVKRPGIISYGISSAGFDARLGFDFKVPVSGFHDPKDSGAVVWRDERHEQGEPIVLLPNSFVLAVTMESFCVPDDCLGIVIGKSSYARCGVHPLCTPLEPAWRGEIVLELANMSRLPALVYPGEGVVQVYFLRLEKHPLRTYANKENAKYQDQKGVITAKVDS